MSGERAGVAREMARLNVAVRTDQRAAVDRLAEEEDLTPAQVTRRLLDLGLARWSDAEGAADDLSDVVRGGSSVHGKLAGVAV